MYGQYNPYMQQRIAQPPLYQPSYPQVIQQIKGRPVTNIEEARAAQIDFDGSSTYFPSIAEGKIYEKAIDLNGTPIFRVYELAKPQEEKKISYAETEQVKALQQKVELLEQRINDIRGGMRYEPVPNNTNVTASQQPAGYDAVNNRQQSNVSAGNENVAGQKPGTDTADNTQPRQRAWYE